MGYSFQLEKQGFFYMHHPTDRIVYTMGFVTPVMEHWLEREIAQWVHHEQMLYHRATSHSNRKEGNVLFDILNTFYLRLYGIRHVVKNHSAREESRCHHIGYSFRLAARVLLYASSHRQDNTYHGLCYTSHEVLAKTRNNSMGPPHEGSIR